MTHSWVGIVAAAVGLGVMVFVHEWGHFIVARLCGVRVLVFSLGYGNRIFGWKRGATDYRISIFPLGGYVKMAGDNASEELTGAPDEFLTQPRWKRVLIVLAGPAMNAVLAIALMWGLYVAGVPVARYMKEPAQVAGVIPNSLAAKSGLKPGDRIVAINGTNVATWSEVLSDASIVPGTSTSLKVERNGELLDITEEVPKDVLDVASVIGYPAAGRVLVDTVQPGFPAAKDGLESGDEILSANGVKQPNPALLADMIRSSGGKPVQFFIRRQGKDLTLLIKPTFGDPDDSTTRWVIGAMFRPAELVRKSLPVGEAAEQSWTQNVSMVREIVKVFGGLFSGRISIKQLAGPVGIMQMSTQAAKMGLPEFLTFMAFLSINLGIVNLLPIPILDGGHILMFTIEGALRRDLSVAVKERFLTVGLVFLLAIFGFVMYFDVLRLSNH